MNNNNTEEKNAELLLGQLFKDTKFENKIFSVGGFVRDELMGLKSKDLDLVVNFDGGSKEVVHILKRDLNSSVTNPHNLGNGFPIWQITFIDNVVFNNIEWKVKGAILEFADTQKESFPDDVPAANRQQSGSALTAATPAHQKQPAAA